MGDELVWAHCNHCGRSRHKVGARHVTSVHDEDHIATFYNSWDSEAFILECAGCGANSFRLKFKYDDWERPDISHYPSPAYRRKPEWFVKFGDTDQTREIEKLLEEVYSALAAGLNRLALMGIRCVIDMVIRETVGDQGDFGKGLVALKEKNHLTSSEAELLKTTVEAGHAAAHRSFRPGKEDLAAAMDTMEHLIQKIFVLPSQVAKLRSRTPPRPPKPPKPKKAKKPETT